MRIKGELPHVVGQMFSVWFLYEPLRNNVWLLLIVQLINKKMTKKATRYI